MNFKIVVLLLLGILCLSCQGQGTAAQGKRICSSCGDPHFNDFYGNYFTWQGTGDFLFTYFSGTVIEARQVPCFSGVTCNAGVAIGTTALGTVWQVLGDSVTWNSAPQAALTIGTPVIFSPSLTVTRTAPGYYTATIPDGEVRWEWYGSYGCIYATIFNPAVPTPPYGLCSNNTRCPTIPTRGPPKDPVTPQKGADTWMVLNEAESAFTYTASLPFNIVNQPQAPQNNGHFTTTDQNIIAAYTRACSPLQSGSLVDQYGRVLDPKPFWQACVDDVIASGGKTDFAAGVTRQYTIQAQNLVG